MDKSIISTIRNVMPTLIAESIVGVQPMTNTGHIFRSTIISPVPDFIVYNDWLGQAEYEKYSFSEKKHYLVGMKNQVRTWVEEQPLYMWKHSDSANSTIYPALYIVNEELLSWMTLRWG